jgi:hypothetical protein
VPRPARASRRALLTGGAVAGTTLLAASGCGSTGADRTARAAHDDPTAPAVDADSELVEKVGGQVTSALSLAVATGASVPHLQPLSRRLSALHRAHLSELSQPDDVEDGEVKGSAETARARLLRAEEKLQQRLVRAALEAESGALAQVLASMAAAIVQERAVAT